MPEEFFQGVIIQTSPLLCFHVTPGMLTRRLCVSVLHGIFGQKFLRGKLEFFQMQTIKPYVRCSRILACSIVKGLFFSPKATANFIEQSLIILFFPGVNYWKLTVDGVDKNEYLWVQEPRASHLNSYLYCSHAHDCCLLYTSPSPRDA